MKEEKKYLRPVKDWVQFRPMDRPHYVIRQEIEGLKVESLTSCGKRLRGRSTVRVMANRAAKCPKCLAELEKGEPLS